MSQVVKMSGWRWLGPAPGMHEWKSTETIVLSPDTDTGAIFRAWKRVGFENVAPSVGRDTLEGKEQSEFQNGGETMVIYANVSC